MLNDKFLYRKKTNVSSALLILILVFGCSKNQQKDYVTFSGKIANPNSDSLIIGDRWNENYYKKITLLEDGTFKDTLHVKTGYFLVMDGTSMITMYLKKGGDIQMSYNAQDYKTPIVYRGTIAPYSNYLKAYAAATNSFYYDQKHLTLGEKTFRKTMEESQNKMTILLGEAEAQGLDSTFIVTEKEKIATFISEIKTEYYENQYILTNLAKGTPSPVFTAYKNVNGNHNSLEDFKGSYILIDLWATWCAPCVAEVPHLRALEEKYHDKNIRFVSISLDRKQDYNKWKEMVLTKKMPGIHLFANGDNSFANAYKASTIPRFLILDPEGKIIDSNAATPSSGKLEVLFDALL